MSESEPAPLGIRKRRALLRKLVHELFAERSLIVASNRGPVSFRRSRSGKIRRRRGAGGVVSAVSAISRYVNPVWVCSPMSSVDREMAEETPGELIPYSTTDYSYRLRFVLIDEESFEQFYSTVSNPLLWFLQHYMWDVARAPTFTPETWDAWEGYQRVNRAFAEAIAEEVATAGRPAIVMLQDYHLYLCPGALAPRLPDGCLLSHFIHIPWPGPDYWMILPLSIREQILSSLCSNDILGFHTKRYALNFLRTCQSFLSGAEVDYASRTVTQDDKVLRVRNYPISIDVPALRSVSRAAKTARRREQLLSRLGEQNIVRIDRVEPSKNIIRGFQAFDLLLERYPEYQGRVRFLAFLVPSRLGIEEYEQYLEELGVTAQRINVKYGDSEWQPVALFVGDDFARSVAAMQLYDVLLVNPIIDGMNLVAKEGPMVNERDGVLILSEGAGASEELAEGALMVSPYDLVETAEAMHQALLMSPRERAQRAETLRSIVEGHRVGDWLHDQLLDLSLLPGARGFRPSPLQNLGEVKARRVPPR
jgi:trehalose 6-phosphate synthase